MEEIFKEIIGYEGLYWISNLGNVKSKHKILKPVINKDGYYCVSLSKKGKLKTYTLHRLIALHFIENPDNLPQVNHKDENKLNNNADNLEWCTKAYNNSYGTKAKRQSETRKKLFREGKLKVWNKK